MPGTEQTQTRETGPVKRTTEHLKSVGRGLVQMAATAAMPAVLRQMGRHPKMMERLASADSLSPSDRRWRSAQIMGGAVVLADVLLLSAFAGGSAILSSKEEHAAERVRQAHATALRVADECTGDDGDSGIFRFHNADGETRETRIIDWGKRYGDNGAVTLTIGGGPGNRGETTTVDSDLLTSVVPDGTVDVTTDVGINYGPNDGEELPFSRALKYDIFANSPGSGLTIQRDEGNSLSAIPKLADRAEELFMQIGDVCPDPVDGTG